MHETHSAALAAAVADTRGSKLRKAVRPGLHKYAVRELARKRAAGLSVTARLFFDGEMQVVLPDVISESVYLYGIFDEVVSSMALEAVRPGDTVIDVGAHFGYFTMLFSELAGPAGRVISFEPTPATFEVLASNAARRTNVTPVQAAAGAENGTCEIADYGLRLLAWNTTTGTSRLGEGDVAARATVRSVPLRRIDDFVVEHGIVPNVVKIDVENAEDKVIAGMAETIRRQRPKIIIEAGSAASLEAARQILAEGYRPRVYVRFGEVVDWKRDIADANAIGRDILFLPA